MENYKIVLFLCNWAPHGAFQDLQEDGYKIPGEIKMIRIPCTGRISKALLFKAFEMGADGVALAGCAPGACRYGSGTDNAIKNTEDTREIIEVLGLGRERLRLATFLPDDVDPMKNFLADFVADIKALGKSPIVSAAPGEGFPEKALSEPGQDLLDMAPATTGETIRKIILKHDAYACQDCGKCTSSCPLALCGKDFSPRTLVGSLIAGEIDSENVKNNIWSCLTCGTCYERCPSEVNFPLLIQDLRSVLFNRKESHQTHGGFFHSLMRSMTSPGLQQKRWADLPVTIKTDPESKTLFYGGCAPYFDLFFRNHQQVKNAKVLNDGLRLLNFFDVTPRILENERCCGHDLLWSGDRENFLKIARINGDYLNSLGIEEMITACPECYKTFIQTYKENGIELNFKVTHLYEFLDAELERGAVTIENPDVNFTYQDSCRLNSMETVRDLPRKLIRRFSKGNFVEMQNHGKTALCCGNSAWIGCDAFSKALQVKRLTQGRNTDSDAMLTSCGKCRIHLGCAMEDPFAGDQLKMELMDLTSVIADHVRWEK
ncbi:MAG: hydrogenase iron-sulfur subunit [Desulfobacterium sp.]